MLSVLLKTCTLCESPRLQTHGHFLDIGSSTAISAESRGRCRSSCQTAFRDSVPASVLARAPRGPLPAPRLVVLEHAPVPRGRRVVPETSALHFVGLGACAFRCVCTSPAAGGAHAHALRTCLFSRLRLDFATEPEPWGRGGAGVCSEWRGPGCLSAATQPRGEATRAPAHFPLSHQTLNYLSLGRSGRLARPPWKPDPPPDPHRRGPRET